MIQLKWAYERASSADGTRVLVDLGLVYRIEVHDARVRVVMTMTSRACPLGDYLKALVDSTIGLVRLGWNLPLPWPDQLIAHGPLMVGGFLGTFVSLERAVALGAAWGYAAPALIATGALVMDLGSMGLLGPWFITTGSIVMAAMGGIIWGRQPSLFLATMTLAAVAWVAGNVQWLWGAAIFLGLVMSMVFAHAPIIFPAVLGVAMPYRRRFYLHVAVLHLSLVLRLLGDLVDSLGRWRVWGGLLNAVALLLFVANTVSSVAMSRARGPHPNGRLALLGLSWRRSLSRARGLGAPPPEP